MVWKRVCSYDCTTQRTCTTSVRVSWNWSGQRFLSLARGFALLIPPDLVSWVKSGWLSLSSLLKIWASNLHPTSHGALLVRNNPWDTPTGRTNCHTSDLTRLLLRELKTRLDTSLPCIEDESCLIARHFLCLWDTRPWFFIPPYRKVLRSQI